MSLNLIVGYTGLLSVTHAAFYGVGAYTTAILMTSYGLNFIASLIFGVIISGILGFAIGYTLSKFDGDYFALGSFGFNIIISGMLVNLQNLTGGAFGISGIGRPSLFGVSLTSNISFLLLAVLFAGIIYAVSQFMTRSSFGRVLQAIREDETALEVFGYKTSHFKLAVFVIGAMIASIAGALLASYISYIDPSTFNLAESIFILSIIILGGLANNKGAVCGAAFLVLLPELLRFAGLPTGIAAELRQMIYGLMLVVLMMYRPQGLIGRYKL